MATMTEGLEYQELHRLSAVKGWRTLFGSATLMFLFIWFPVIVAIPFSVALVVSGEDADGLDRFFSLDPVTPASLAYVLLGLALTTVAAGLVNWLFHNGQRFGWLLSVVGRMRWRWMALCAVISVVVMAVTLVVGGFLPIDESGAVTETQHAWAGFTGQTVAFLVVVLALTPFQAAGEEFVFRGYLAQAWGGWASNRSRQLGRLVAVLAPATVFALAHGLGQEAPVFFDRFAFGIVAGILVIVTGGLEAAIAMHVVNNLLAFGVAIFWGDLTDTLTQTTGSWWLIVTTLTQSLLFLGFTALAARRFGITARQM